MMGIDELRELRDGCAGELRELRDGCAGERRELRDGVPVNEGN
ncbi:MAG: hypothetical protein WD491_02880 [Balneolales bacterium]